MAAWEDLQLGPILGWRHLWGRRTPPFARRPLGRFTALSAQASANDDAQSMAAYLVGLPMPLVEAFRETDIPQVNPFPNWLTEFPTPPQASSALRPQRPQQPSAETENIEATRPHSTSQTRPDMPSLMAQRRPLGSAQPLGNKATEMAQQWLSDRPAFPSQPKDSAIAPSDRIQPQAQLSPSEPSPANLPLATSSTPATNPALNPLESPTHPALKAIHQRPEEAIGETESLRPPENPEFALTPEVRPTPSDLGVPEPNNYDVEPSEAKSLSTEDTGTIQRHVAATESLPEAPISSIPTAVDDTSAGDMAEIEAADRPSIPSTSKTHNTVPNQSGNESGTAAIANPSPTHTPRQIPSLTTSDTVSAESPSLQSPMLNPLPNGMPEAPSPDITQLMQEAVPQASATVESTPKIAPNQANGSLEDDSVQRKMWDTAAAETPKSPSPSTQNLLPEASAAVEPMPAILPDFASPHQAFATTTPPTISPASTSKPGTIQQSPHPISGSDTRDSAAGMVQVDQVVNPAQPHDLHSRDRPPLEPQTSSSGKIPLLPSIQSYIEAQQVTQSQYIKPHSPLAALNAYQFQPIPKATNTPWQETRQPTQTLPSIPEPPATVPPIQASPRQTPIQLNTMETATAALWQDQFDLEPSPADTGLDDIATEDTDADLATADLAALLEVGTEPDAAPEAPPATDAVTLTASDSDIADDEALLDYLAKWIYRELRSHLHRDQEANYGIQSSLLPWYPEYSGFSIPTARSEFNPPSLPLPSKLLQLTTLVRQQVESRLRQDRECTPK